MKHKYRVLEKHYEDGSVWFMPQVGDWWHGWRYICERHPCPEVDLQRLAYKTFDEADAYMRGFIERDKNGTTIPARHCCKWPATVVVHDYTRDCQS